MSKLSILHISDSHFGCPDPNKEAGLIAKALVFAVENHIENHNKPDLCIFTGDLAFSGIDDEFKIAEKWLNSLINVIGEECPLFIVPGNHDVKRPNGKEPKRSLRYAHNNQDSFFRDFYEEVLKGPCLIDFRNWHSEAKTRIPSIVSNWEDSIFGCNYKTNLRSVPISVLGLNTAILSCGDDDKGRLVADISFLNTFLEHCNPKNELIIVCSHHPIGVNEKERWLTSWNDDLLRIVLLQATGPHLYFHGHLHETNGYSMNMASGQSLAFFSAGAAYQGKKYPQRFSFYDVDVFEGAIQSHVYKYDDSGVWLLDPPNSRSVYAVLPRLDKQASHFPVNNIDTSLIQKLLQQHLRFHQILVNQIIPCFGLDMLSNEEKRSLLNNEFTEEKAADLTRASVQQINDIPTELSEASKLLQLGKSEDAAACLLKIRKSEPKRWENEPYFFELLLSALTSSKNTIHWEEALKLLPIYGKAIHYNWLSYAMWTNGQLDIAVNLAENARSRLETPPNPDEIQLSNKIFNNLAYFYAASNKTDKKEEALNIIEKALNYVKDYTNDSEKQDLYALYLDTRGFVRIALGSNEEEIRMGMTDCEKARSLGSDEKLYFKHIAFASNRLMPKPDESDQN